MLMDPQQPVAPPPPPPEQQPQRPTQPSPVNVTNVVALANPATFASPLDFEITFECTAALPDDLEWRMVYVGSADDSSYDQLLTEVEVGPVPVGVNKFVLSGDAPNPAAIPPGDLLGVTTENALAASLAKGKKMLACW